MDMMRRKNMQHVAEVHRANLRQRLAQRIEAARANGDTALLQVLEREREQLT